jgi:hypothetical protein
MYLISNKIDKPPATDSFNKLFSESIVRVFEKIANDCPHRRQDLKGVFVCTFHDSAIGDCFLDLCPRINARLNLGVRNADNP